ncbi:MULTISPECIES: hypothetical protein [unclassified Aureispira]|uniref:hypothetical protein n=1 Tax=unclassified Aureispira TaxID=2649989 RepID=UPI0006982BA3|nr:MULTISPECIES: hypothetical protein [unclassified Aureispira]WMX14516.1 hypothetical protein QP953_27035 [Aureispira sp. CCB-E]
MKNIKLERLLKANKLETTILPADIYFSKTLDIKRDNINHKSTIISPIRIQRYNYIGKEIYVPKKNISKILNPNQIITDENTSH